LALPSLSQEILQVRDGSLLAIKAMSSAYVSQQLEAASARCKNRIKVLNGKKAPFLFLYLIMDGPKFVKRVFSKSLLGPFFEKSELSGIF
jgi:hypothetical protein